MRLKAEQLTSSLQRNGLAPIYVISGDESLQVTECVDRIRSLARDQGFEERIVFVVENGFDWNALLEETATASLFSAKRLFELRLGDRSPGKEGGSVLAQYAGNPPPDTVLVISAGKLDKDTQQTKWYRALDQRGVMVQVWPITPDQLPEWIRQRLAGKGKNISMEAAALLAEQVEGNLLAASQEIDKLCLLTDNAAITLTDINSFASDNSRFEVFSLLESAMAGDAKRCVRMLSGLRAEGLEPMSIHGPLLWEFRRVCSMASHAGAGTAIEKLFIEYRIWNDQRKSAIREVLRRHTPDQLHALLRTALTVERKIKGPDKIMAWDMLEALLLAIAGKPLRQNTGVAA